MGYTPRHAKPVSRKEAGLSGHAPTAVAAPSVGRHARPEKPAAQRDSGVTARGVTASGVTAATRGAKKKVTAGVGATRP